MQKSAFVALRKPALPAGPVRARLADFPAFEGVPASAKPVAGALHLQRAQRLSFCNALIVQAAGRGGCGQPLTDGTHAGATVAGVRLVDPLA